MASWKPPLNGEIALGNARRLSAADEFVRGKRALYTGFDGRLYIATYADGEKNGCGIGGLTIKNSAGEIVGDVLMGEHNARGFYWNLDAQAEAVGG